MGPTIFRTNFSWKSWRAKLFENDCTIIVSLRAEAQWQKASEEFSFKNNVSNVFFQITLISYLPITGIYFFLASKINLFSHYSFFLSWLESMFPNLFKLFKEKNSLDSLWNYFSWSKFLEGKFAYISFNIVSSSSCTKKGKTQKKSFF